MQICFIFIWYYFFFKWLLCFSLSWCIFLRFSKVYFLAMALRVISILAFLFFFLLKGDAALFKDCWIVSVIDFKLYCSTVYTVPNQCLYNQFNMKCHAPTNDISYTHKLMIFLTTVFLKRYEKDLLESIPCEFVCHTILFLDCHINFLFPLLVKFRIS